MEGDLRRMKTRVAQIAGKKKNDKGASNMI
jgi:hypothetical protein